MPDSGDISIRGKLVNKVPAQRRNIGFVFQNYALFKTMTVFGNIAFGLKIKKWDKTRIEANPLDKVKELDNAAKTPVPVPLARLTGMIASAPTW